MTQSEITKAKEDFLLKRQDKLLEGATELEKKLFQAILNKFIERLVVDNGVISTKDNDLITLTKALDQVFDEFKKEIKGIANQVQTDFTKILNFNGQYYSSFDTNGKRYSDIKNNVYDVMSSRVGINENGGYVKGGFLDQLIQDTTLRSDIKNATLKAVTGGVKLSDFIDSTKTQIMGSDNVDGSLVKYYKGFAYDTYQQFDRSTNQQFATNLDLTTFVYTGGLIDDSREFCIDKNRKVFTIEEAQRDWPKDPKLLKTKAEKDSGTLSDYSPLIDLGRWNCRHTLRFISKQEAVRLRPDLKQYVDIRKQSDVLRAKAVAAGPQVDKFANDLADKHGATVTPINLKSRASIERKTKDDYGGDVSLVKDAVRNTIIGTNNQVKQIMEDFKNLINPKTDRIKIQNDETMGYRGNLVNMLTDKGIYSEIQVNTPKMIYAKEEFAKGILGQELFDKIAKETGLPSGLGHKYYEEWRVLKDEIPAEKLKREAIAAKSREYYKNFY